MNSFFETISGAAILAMAAAAIRALRRNQEIAALHILALGSAGSAFFAFVPFFGAAGLYVSLLTAAVGLLLLVDAPMAHHQGELGESTLTRRK